MRKEFSMSNDKVIINFTAKYCKTFEMLLESEGFRRVIDVYLKKSEKKNTLAFRYVKKTLGTDDIAELRKDIIKVFKCLTVMSAREISESNPRYVELLADKDEFVALVEDDIAELRKDIIKVFKCLTVMSAREISESNPRYVELLADKDEFVALVEDLYLFWRRLERYTLIHTGSIEHGLAAVSFTEANAEFSKLVLKLYRKVEKNVIGGEPQVFRQIPAGGNSCIKIGMMMWPIPRGYEAIELKLYRKVEKNVIGGEPQVFRQIPAGGNSCIKIGMMMWPIPRGYEAIEYVPFIDSILLETPFITYPKRSTRDGMFTEVFENPLQDANINSDHWFCYPAKIGESLAYVYFHRDYMEHGITLCNLFEMARKEECRGRKPDIVYVFGATDDNEELKTVFYEDKKNDIMLGYVNHSIQIR